MKHFRVYKWREIFRVYIEYVNTALNQSAFRIHKCYIIIKYSSQCSSITLYHGAVVEVLEYMSLVCEK